MLCLVQRLYICMTTTVSYDPEEHISQAEMTMRSMKRLESLQINPKQQSFPDILGNRHRSEFSHRWFGFVRKAVLLVSGGCRQQYFLRNVVLWNSLPATLNQIMVLALFLSVIFKHLLMPQLSTLETKGLLLLISTFTLWKDLVLGFLSRSAFVYITLLKECEERLLQATDSAVGIFSSSTV